MMFLLPQDHHLLLPLNRLQRWHDRRRCTAAIGRGGGVEREGVKIVLIVTIVVDIVIVVVVIIVIADGREWIGRRGCGGVHCHGIFVSVPRPHRIDKYRRFIATLSSRPSPLYRHICFPSFSLLETHSPATMNMILISSSYGSQHTPATATITIASSSSAW
jgi:hypothetical protein